MKIVHVANYFLPEFGYQEHYLAKKHADLGHEVHVVTSNKAYPAHDGYEIFSQFYPSRDLSVGEEKRDGYTVHRLRAVAERNMQLFLAGLSEILESLSPDLVVMHGLTRYETLHLCLLKKFRRVSFKLLVDDHSLYAGYVPKFYRTVYYGILRFLLRTVGLASAIDRIIPVSLETAHLLHEQFGISNDQMTVIPIGADCDRFTYSEMGRSNIRKKLGIPSDAVVLSYIGKIVAERGVDLAYSIAASALKSNSGFYFLVVGSGAESTFAKSIRDRVKMDGFENRVIFHGHVSHDELRDYYSASDIAIWARQETMAALEAASCGLPLILGNSEIARERLAGGNGFNCKTPAEMEQALAILVGDPALRKKMGENGARFVRERFDWTKIAEQFLTPEKAR